MSKQIYAFAFKKNNISVSTLYQLNNTHLSYQLFPNNLDHFLKLLLHDQPSYILGLGVYSGVDQEKIRIETKCTNRFKNGYIDGETLKETDINYYLAPGPNTKFADALGNSQCNLACWRVMEHIKVGDLKSQLTFLHIPKKFGVANAVEEIDTMIENFSY